VVTSKLHNIVILIIGIYFKQGYFYRLILASLSPAGIEPTFPTCPATNEVRLMPDSRARQGGFLEIPLNGGISTAERKIRVR
jgi:hypothetical protein